MQNFATIPPSKENQIIVNKIRNGHADSDQDREQNSLLNSDLNNEGLVQQKPNGAKAMNISGLTSRAFSGRL